MRMTNLAFAALSAAALTFGGACRGDDSDGGDPADTGDDPGDADVTGDGGITGTVTVQQVQSDAVADGAAIELEGVIVTAIDAYGARTGDFWVQEPGGGEFSGVRVFGAPLDVVAGLTLGAVVKIDGAKKVEFRRDDFQVGYSITQVVAESTGSMIVTVTGTGTVPTPNVVDAQAIAALPDFMARDAEWEKWEGVLVKVEKVNALGAPVCVGTACSDPTNQTLDITGDIDIQTSMAALPADVGLGDCFASVTGVVDYFYDYHIYNRTSADVVTGGTGCTLTNQEATISEVQTGAVTGVVTLTDVYVVARSLNGKNLWVSSSLTAAPNEGIFVFFGTSAITPVLPANVVPGAKVTVLGTVDEFNLGGGTETVTQIESPEVTVTAAPAGLPIAVTSQTAATLNVAATGEPYESVLVTLTNVEIVSTGSATFYVGSAQQGATTFLVDDDAFRLPEAEAGKCYASVTGFWSYQPFDDKYGFYPTAVGTGTGVCP